MKLFFTPLHLEKSLRSEADFAMPGTKTRQNECVPAK